MQVKESRDTGTYIYYLFTIWHNARALKSILFWFYVWFVEESPKTHLKVLQFLGQNLHKNYVEALVISRKNSRKRVAELFLLTCAVFLSGPLDKNFEIKKYNSANENEGKC